MSNDRGWGGTLSFLSTGLAPFRAKRMKPCDTCGALLTDTGVREACVAGRGVEYQPNGYFFQVINGVAPTPSKADGIVILLVDDLTRVVPHASSRRGRGLLQDKGTIDL